MLIQTCERTQNTINKEVSSIKLAELSVDSVNIDISNILQHSWEST